MKSKHVTAAPSCSGLAASKARCTGGEQSGIGSDPAKGILETTLSGLDTIPLCLARLFRPSHSQLRKLHHSTTYDQRETTLCPLKDMRCLVPPFPRLRDYCRPCRPTTSTPPRPLSCDIEQQLDR